MRYTSFNAANDITIPPARAFIDKVDAATLDLSIVVTGDSTGTTGTTPWPRVMANLIGAQWPTHKVLYYVWNTTNTSYDAAVTVQAGSPGTRTISVYNGSVASTTAQYPFGFTRLEPMILTPAPDVLIVNHGHNHTNVPELSWATLSAFTETITQHLPSAQLYLVAQNPRTADNVSEISTQTTWNLGRLRGFGVIDAYSAFKQDASWSTNLMQDTIHPNTAGAALIGREAFKAFDVTSAAARSTQPVQQPSSFTTGGENLLYNSMFKRWISPAANNAPVSWSRYLGSGGASVLELGTTTELNTTPVRIRTTVNNQTVWLFQNLDATQRARIAGRRVTLSFRCYLPSGSQTGSGVLNPIFTWNSSANQFQPAQGAANSVQQVFDRWFWVTLPYDVPQSVPSDLTVGLNAVNTTGIIDAIVDRCTMTLGALPVDWSPALAETQALVENPVDPINDLRIAEEFISGYAAAGGIGAQGWGNANGATTILSSEVGHPGIQQLSSSAVSGTSASLYQHNGSSTLHTSDTFSVTFIVRLNTNDTDTLVRVGLSADISLAQPANGIYFEKLAADTSWFGVTRASASQTRTAAIAATSTSWVKLRIRRVNSTTVAFSVNNGAEVIATATIPALSATPWMLINNATAVAKTIDIDYNEVRVTGLAR